LGSRKGRHTLRSRPPPFCKANGARACARAEERVPGVSLRAY
jgi:hypothetical protein